MKSRNKAVSLNHNILLVFLGLSYFILLILMFPLSSYGDGHIPLWSTNALNMSFEKITIASQCGPADNEVCISCHELMENAPDPKLTMISDVTHGTGVYRLSASEYLSINMHTFSKYMKPRCTNCHFNPRISKAELKSFKYSKIGDKLCYTCHQNKAPKKYRTAETDRLLAAEKNSSESPFVKKIRDKFFAKRDSVIAYRKRMKLY